MSVFSNWEVLWDPTPGTPIVFLAVGQEIADEIVFPWEQDHVERQVIEGQFTEPLPRSKVRGSLAFTAIKEHASNAAAQDYLNTHRAVIHGLRGLRKTLRITPYQTTGPGAVNRANTMLKSAVGRVVVSDEDEPKTAFTYLFLGPW